MILLARLCFIGAAIAFVLFILSLFGILVVGSTGYLIGVTIALALIGVVLQYFAGGGRVV
jgi:hypothetical protein